MRTKLVKENIYDNFSKLKSYLSPIKEKLISSLERNVSHLVEDKGGDLIAILTDEKYPILLKVLGYDRLHESLNEERFSTIEISFNKEDVDDKILDAKFYLEEIENNLNGIDLTSKGFKFDEAFDKLKKCLDDIYSAKEPEEENAHN
jgi:hypothetical protein